MVVVVAVADAAAEVSVGRADGCATAVSGVVTEVAVAVGVCCDCRSCIGEVVAILRQVLQDAKIRRIVGNQPLLCHIRHAGNGRHRVNVGQVKPVDALGWQLRQVGGHHTVRDFSTFTINGLEDVIFSAAAATAAREGNAANTTGRPAAAYILIATTLATIINNSNVPLGWSFITLWWAIIISYSVF